MLYLRYGGVSKINVIPQRRYEYHRQTKNRSLKVDEGQVEIQSVSWIP